MLKLTLRLFIYFSFFFAFSITASAANTQERCGSTANVPLYVPAGWVLTDSYHSNNCANDPTYPTLPNANQITEYDNLPVGTTLLTCNAVAPAGSGWSSSGSSYNASRCGCPYANCTPFAPNVTIWTHNTCAPPQASSSCYPPPPPAATGHISAAASSVTIPYGQSNGSVSVSWTSQNTGSVCIWVSNSGGPVRASQCFGPSGSWTWSYVPAGGNTKFILSTNADGAAPNPVLSTVTVNGIAGAQPTIHATPNPVIIPWGSTSANTTVTWSAPGYAGLDVWTSTNGGPWVWSVSAQSSYSVVLPISAGQTVGMRLYPYSSDSSHPGQGGTANLLASTTITGVAGAQPTFSANPSHVVVPAGSTTGNTTVSWNAPGFAGLDLWTSTNGGAYQWSASAQASGSSVLSVTIGNTYSIRFYPYNSDSTHPNEGGTLGLLGTVNITVSH